MKTKKKIFTRSRYSNSKEWKENTCFDVVENWNEVAALFDNFDDEELDGGVIIEFILNNEPAQCFLSKDVKKTEETWEKNILDIVQRQTRIGQFCVMIETT